MLFCDCCVVWVWCVFPSGGIFGAFDHVYLSGSFVSLIIHFRKLLRKEDEQAIRKWIDWSQQIQYEMNVKWRVAGKSALRNHFESIKFIYFRLLKTGSIHYFILLDRPKITAKMTWTKCACNSFVYRLSIKDHIFSISIKIVRVCIII